MPVVLAATVPSIADSEARHNDAKLNRQGLQMPANIRRSDRSAGGAASHCVIGPMTTQARTLPPFWAVARLVTRMSGSVQSRLFCSMQKRELTVRGIGEFGDLDHL
jgi:hypothetical protein